MADEKPEETQEPARMTEGERLSRFDQLCYSLRDVDSLDRCILLQTLAAFYGVRIGPR